MSMHTRRSKFVFTFTLWLALVALLLFPVRSLGQQALAPGALSTEVAQLAAGAGTVFVGQIVSIHRTAGVVEVSFRVEQLMRGGSDAGSSPAGSSPAKGLAGAQILVMREWAGMWAPGQQRYLPGARVLAFLHTASRAGFASPVHGSEGLVPVLVQGAGRTPQVDLRRVAASVVRGPQTALPSLAEASVPLTTLLPVIAAHAPAAGLRGGVDALPAGLRPTNGLLQSLQTRRGAVQGTPVPKADHHAAL